MNYARSKVAAGAMAATAVLCLVSAGGAEAGVVQPHTQGHEQVAPSKCGGTAKWYPDPTGVGHVTGTYTSCGGTLAYIQLDRGGDSNCYWIQAGQTKTVTYTPRFAAFPGDARWVRCP